MRWPVELLILFGFADIASIISVAGMAAVSSAVIGAPVSAVLIILELTQSYEYAVAAMIAVMVCNLLTNRLFGNSFFDRQLLDRGIDLLKGARPLPSTSNLSAPLPVRTMFARNPRSAALSCVEEMRSAGIPKPTFSMTTGSSSARFLFMK